MEKLHIMSNFSHCHNCFQIYSIIVLSISEISRIFSDMFSKLSAVDLLYVGKGYFIDDIFLKHFSKSFSHIMAASSPTHVFLGCLAPVLHTAIPPHGLAHA